jgi:rhodanese-related sulfurtransferase
MKLNFNLQSGAMKSVIIIAAFTVLLSCGSSNKKESIELINQSSRLLDYLEENGNLVNSSSVPALIDATEVFQNLKGKNFLIIDLRREDIYKEGHIENSVNVRPENILNYFEKVIEPSSFEKIVLVCPNSFLSGHVNFALMVLGYNNVYTMRYGLSSWNEEAAKHYWLESISSHLEDKLDKTTYSKPEKGELPIIETEEKITFNILRTRVSEVLNVSLKDVVVSHKELLEDPDKYFIICYWPDALYEKGHLPGAIQYTPKQSLTKEKDLLTLPTNKPIAVYCYTASHSAFVASYLRILGYDAYNVEYGANAFINNTMVNTQTFNRGFKEDHINNFPLVSGDENGNGEEVKTETIIIQGGC